MDHSDEEAPMETEEEVEEQRWVAFTEELFAQFSGDISDDDRWRCAIAFVLYYWESSVYYYMH